MFRWKIGIEYDGAPFVGWQRQPDRSSVQSEVETALSRLFDEPITVIGAGRTDVGVHALGQVASFTTNQHRTPEEVILGANGRLPDTIAVTSAETVPMDFHPMLHATSKRYRYAWHDGLVRSPLLRHRTWQFRSRLNDGAMNDAVACLVGKHDFSSFRAEGSTAPHSVREVLSASVIREGNSVFFDIVGTGFLRKMVRIIAGTITQVGLDRKPVEFLQQSMAAQNREASGPTAPAQGLTMVAVSYQPLQRLQRL